MENSSNVYWENKVNEFKENLSSSRVRAEQIRTKLLVFLSFVEMVYDGGKKEEVIADIREQLKSIEEIINQIKDMENEVEG